MMVSDLQRMTHREGYPASTVVTQRNLGSMFVVFSPDFELPHQNFPVSQLSSLFFKYFF